MLLWHFKPFPLRKSSARKFALAKKITFRRSAKVNTVLWSPHCIPDVCNTKLNTIPKKSRTRGVLTLSTCADNIILPNKLTNYLGPFWNNSMGRFHKSGEQVRSTIWVHDPGSKASNKVQSGTTPCF